MKKTWGFIVFFIGYQSFLYSAFDVKIGVYSNIKNLHHNIAQLESSIYKNKIVVIKKGTLYYAHAMFRTKSKANKALKSYKSVFNDAFITKDETVIKKEQKKKKITKKKLEKPKSKPVAPKKSAVKKVVLKSNKKVIKPEVKPLKTITKEKITKEELVKEKNKALFVKKIADVAPSIKEEIAVKKVIEKTVIPLAAPVSKITKIKKKIPEKYIKKRDTFIGKLFLDKTFYVCSTFRSDTEVVKVHFTSLYLLYDYTHNSGHKVSYNFHEKSIAMDMMAMKVLHTYVSKELDYLVLDVTINGILVDKLRYFYDKDKAMKYLAK